MRSKQLQKSSYLKKEKKITNIKTCKPILFNNIAIYNFNIITVNINVYALASFWTLKLAEMLTELC